MGATVEAKAFLNTRGLRDLSFLTMQDNSIVDASSYVMKHEFDSDLHYRPTVLGKAATLHPFSVCICNRTVQDGRCLAPMQCGVSRERIKRH